jgi:formate hydrogenlyase subunit 3/multisubunit Na+/H+ antiporter MnhD subunit
MSGLTNDKFLSPDVMKSLVIKIGAAIVLFFAILITLILLFVAFYVVVFYHDANFTKKITVAGGLVILSLIIILVGIAIFEVMYELANFEKEHSDVGPHVITPTNQSVSLSANSLDSIGHKTEPGLGLSSKVVTSDTKKAENNTENKQS